MKIIEITKENSGLRADKFISMSDSSVTRSYALKLFNDNMVTVNGKIIKKNYILKENDIIKFEIPEIKELDVKKENIPLDIVYEDNDIIVVNKKKGMVVHPAAGNYSGTLVNALLFHCDGNLSGINGIARPGIVHRIDKNTSGLLIVAKTNEAHLNLAAQIKEHSFTREYKAVVEGKFKEKIGMIDLPIGRNPKDRKKMAVTNINSKNAVTHYEVLSENSRVSFVKFRLETGRTHQIRVHMAYKGHPIVNDDVYNSKKYKFNYEGQCLHAGKIGFVHPIKKVYMEFESDLPEYFLFTLKKYNLLGDNFNFE